MLGPEHMNKSFKKKNTHVWESTSKNQSGSLHIQVTFIFSGFLAHLAAIPTEEGCGYAGQEQRSRISSRNKSSGCCRGCFRKPHALWGDWIDTWWLIPVSKWGITPVISGISRVNLPKPGVISRLLSGMSHQVHSCSPPY